MPDIEILAEANRLSAAGLSVIAIKNDGTKAPAITSWKQFQRRSPNEADRKQMFARNKVGIAVICGKVSGSLEVIDFESGAPMKEWEQLIKSHPAGTDLLGKLVLVKTPTGGWHVVYRCKDGIERNQKLARKLVSNEGGKERPEVLIETRGEGGYVLAPGSPRSCHPSGKPYTLIRGDLANIPYVTTRERALLLDSARSFNEVIKPKGIVRGPSKTTGKRPGDDFNTRASWEEILQPHEWEQEKRCGETTHWHRPGKNKGTSATTDYDGSDLFYCFSSNGDPFEADIAYSKFAAYTYLNHGGDFKAAAADLAAKGYGKHEISHQNSTRISSVKNETDFMYFGFNDSGNAERFLALFGQDVRYCPAFKKWLVWDKRRWVIDDLGLATKRAKEAMIQFFCQAVRAGSKDAEKFAKGSLNATRIKGLLEMAMCELPIDVKSLDTHHYLLNCLNGTLDLTTGELREHRRQDFITKLVHFDYKPDAECPLFTGFIHEIMGASPDSSESELRRSSGLVDYLHKAFGYSSTGDVSEKAIFCCFGDGNNGKTTLLETIAQVLAEYSSQLVIDTLMTKRFESNNSSADIADLRGARFVTTSEGEEGQRLAEAKVKYLSAGMGKIKTARKYENHIQFQATHKLFMDSNHKPVVRGVDNAIWNRLKAIPFNITIPKDRIDKGMLEKLLGEAEGILAWIVEGCLRWQKEGLGEPPEVVETKKGWREEMDLLKDFVEDRCVVKEGTQCKSSELRMAYEDWAKKNGETVLSSKWFANRLKVLGCESGKIGGARGWKGIGLKELKD